ncbi:MAG: ATP-grasp domain-containing protein [Microthrixaceae bacterium]
MLPFNGGRLGPARYWVADITRLVSPAGCGPRGPRPGTDTGDAGRAPAEQEGRRGWTSSNTRESSSSPPSASRCPTGEAVDDGRRRRRRRRARSGYPVVVKAQVHVGGRGKAGGVKLANDADEVPRARHATSSGIDIKGHVVDDHLDRARLRHRRGVLRQLHARPLAPRSTSACSRAQGGVEIEAVAESNPDAIAKIWVDPVDGLDRGSRP